MKSKSHEATSLGALGAAVGKGIIAGFAGTVAMTISQTIEMKITGREPSTAPADGVEKALHINVEDSHKKAFSNGVHFSYGSLNGIVRSLLSLAGITGAAATGVHLAAIWGTAITIEPKLDIAPPVTEWEPKTIATDILHHAVYAVVTGLVFDAID